MGKQKGPTNDDNNRPKMSQGGHEVECGDEVLSTLFEADPLTSAGRNAAVPLSDGRGTASLLLNIEELRLSQDYTEAYDVEALLTAVPVRKPGPQEFIRTHPDEEFRLQTKVLEVKEEREIFIVHRSLWGGLEGEAGFGPRLLILCINRAGVAFIWPLRLPREEGRSDRWAQSALAAANEATKSWVRVRANMGLGAYEAFRALGELPEPTWPERSFEEFVSEAFREAFITTPDHPVLQKLRGEV